MAIWEIVPEKAPAITETAENDSGAASQVETEEKITHDSNGVDGRQIVGEMAATTTAIPRGKIPVVVREYL